MRIVLDTGDLRELANAAASASTQVHAARTDVSNARNAVVLNTREDVTLRRHNPDEDAHRILRELDRLEDEYREISRSYERQADAVEEASRSAWVPMPFPIHFEMPSFGRLRPPSPFGVIPGGISGIVSRVVPPFLGAARSTVSSIGRTAASTVQRGFGFIRSGWNNARRGFTSLFDRLRETVAEAWARVWSRTQEMLRSVINGIKDIVAFSGNVITQAWNQATTTVGRWITSGARNVSNFLGRTWDSLVSVVDLVFTAVDVVTVLGIFRSVSKIFEKFKLSTAFGAIFAVVDFVRYGLGDARFWESAFKLVAGIAIGIASGFVVGSALAAGTIAAIGSLVLIPAFWFGGKLSEWFFMPILDRNAEMEERLRDFENQEFFRRMPRKHNPHVGDGTDLETSVPTVTQNAYSEVLAEAAGSVESRFAAANKHDKYIDGLSYDKYNMAYNASGNCTSFVAWRLNDLATRAGHDGYRFDNNTLDYGNGQVVNLGRMGNAREWVESAKAAGIPVSDNPAAGSVLVWEKGDGKAWSGGDDGHVAIVKEVLADGSIVIQESSWGSDVFNETTLLPGDFPKKFLNLLPH